MELAEPAALGGEADSANADLPIGNTVSGSGANSIAELTEAELRFFGQSAGMDAFDTALDAGIPVPMMLGGRLVFVTKADPDPNAR